MQSVKEKEGNHQFKHKTVKNKQKQQNHEIFSCGIQLQKAKHCYIENNWRSPEVLSLKRPLIYLEY